MRSGSYSSNILFEALSQAYSAIVMTIWRPENLFANMCLRSLRLTWRPDLRLSNYVADDCSTPTLLRILLIIGDLYYLSLVLISRKNCYIGLTLFDMGERAWWLPKIVLTTVKRFRVGSWNFVNFRINMWSIKKVIFGCSGCLVVP